MSVRERVTSQPIKVRLINGRIIAGLAACIALLIVSTSAVIAQDIDIRTNYRDISRFVEFDHIETGFALTGSHKHLGCINCHLSGQNEKLPHRCDACHNNDRATGMPKNHIATREPCDICHTTKGFIEQIDMDHRNTRAQCVFCHDGYSQTGKSIMHISSSNNCKLCHTTQRWLPLGSVEHREISVSACDSCHNNTITTGKDPAKHMNTSNQCQACHRSHSRNWHAFRIDHEQVQGTCNSCHNGILATGPGAPHIPFNLDCDACHGVLGWQGFQFSHTQVSEFRCVRCHDTILLAGKPINHVTSSNECESCHDSDASWRVVRQFDHSDVAGPCQQCHQLPVGHVASMDECDICHQTIAWSLVYVRHLSLQATACRDCHNNLYAVGKPATHCPVNDDCNVCHTVNHWQSAQQCGSKSNEGHDGHRSKHP